MFAFSTFTDIPEKPDFKMFYAWKKSVHIELRRCPRQTRPTTVDTARNPCFKPVLECLDCGACCQARDGTILIIDEDIEKWKREGRKDILSNLEPGHFGQLAFKMTKAHRCVFQGTSESPHACQIYGHRATICGAFAKGCPQCYDIRRNRRDFEKTETM